MEQKSITASTNNKWTNLRQLTFNWKLQEKYNELNTLKIEVRNTFLMKNYNTEETERALIIMNWLCNKELRFVQTLTDSEKEKCMTSSRISKVLNDKLKP